MPNKCAELLRRVFMGATRDISSEQRHHESNLVWGPIGIGISLVLTVVAAVKHDMRFLLWVAWPCFIFGAARLVKIIPYARLARWVILVSAPAVGLG